MKAYQKSGRAPCDVIGCEQPWYAKQLCVMHYSRLRAGRDVGTAAPLRRTLGSGSVNPEGYIILTGSTHPLARAQGKVPLHRAVLYDAIGPGTHPCHWCSKPLEWHGPAATRINVDHLDHDRLNNDLANLVPSCLDCNTKRRRFPYQPRERKPYVRTEAQKEAARQRSRAYYWANRERVLARLRERRSDVAS